ncbi:uncharacterized protein LOC110881271 [Helianthus annuus]|uniref:uncharacterized protein LOC110881271 n=1 Tax=Helianthus annuus TaxID=4232 RepID=UPI000B8F8593|nr:uncharacterized protein LOC110881271 [Helianthus annuus]
MNGGKIWDWAWVRALNGDMEKHEMEELEMRLQQHLVVYNNDVWYWSSSEQQCFNVKDARQSLSNQLDLNEQAYEFVWNKWAPGKSLMFVWKAVEEKVPTTTALRGGGVNLQNVICQTCGAAEETAAHVLLQCNFAKRVWEEIVKWTKIPAANTEGNLKELLQELNDLQRSRKMRKAIHAIAIQTMWTI